MSDPIPVPLPPPSAEERYLAMMAHLFGLLGVFAGAIGHIVCPLALYIIKRNDAPFVAFHALQTCLFQLCMSVAIVAGVVVAALTCGLGVPLPILLSVLWLFFSILGTVAAHRGEWSRYPIVGQWTLDHVVARATGSAA